MKALKLSSCMAPIMDPMVAAIADQLSENVGLTVEFVRAADWREREQAFDRGEIDLLWLCGLPYVQRVDGLGQAIQLLAAPVMAAERYQGAPIYFSDILVRRDSDFQSFDDLEGARWGFNEPNSHSGFNVARWHLARQGVDWRYFRSVVEAGSHEEVLRLLLAGRIDAAAVDSTVWELAARHDPAVSQELRVIQSLGPSPIPPWVARAGLDQRLFGLAQKLFLKLHLDPMGRDALNQAGVKRMVPVDDRDYDPVRRMIHEGQVVQPIEWMDSSLD